MPFVQAAQSSAAAATVAAAKRCLRRLHLPRPLMIFGRVPYDYGDTVKRVDVSIFAPFGPGEENSTFVRRVAFFGVEQLVFSQTNRRRFSPPVQRFAPGRVKRYPRRVRFAPEGDVSWQGPAVLPGTWDPTVLSQARFFEGKQAVDVLAGRTSSTSPPVKVSEVRAELPAIEPAGAGGGLPLSFAQQLWLLDQPGGPGPGHPIPWRYPGRRVILY